MAADPDPELRDGLANYQAATALPIDPTTPLRAVRFVVLDCETSGLDPDRHRIVSIGAVGVSGGEIDLGDTFEALLRVRHNNEATLVHGITRSETRAGLDEPTALAGLLGYLGNAVIVGHHLRLDLLMLNAALARHGAGALSNRHLDTGDLLQRLAADGALSGPVGDDPSLDGLCARFGILPYDRHTAAGDAFLTAQALLRLLRLAERRGRGELGWLLGESSSPAADADASGSVVHADDHAGGGEDRTGG